MRSINPETVGDAATQNGMHIDDSTMMLMVIIELFPIRARNYMMKPRLLNMGQRLSFILV